jgi:hypothetical protein
MFSLMMKLHHTDKEPTISLLLVSTVWRQFVLLVVLLLPGQSLTRLSHQQISCSSYKRSIRQKNLDLHIFALTKHVLCCALALLMEAGIYGGRQHDLWSIPIIMSTIEQLIIFVENGATLLH